MENTVYNTGLAKWQYGEPLTGYNEWHKYLGPCPHCGTPCFDYGGGWRCLDSNCFYSASNPAGNLGAPLAWWNTGIQVVKDGNAWCAHYYDFVNLQESECAFGDTPKDAVRDFLSIISKTA